MKRVIAASAFVAGLLAAASAQAANLVQNGGFELGSFTDTSGGFNYDQITAGGTDLANWAVGNSLAWGLNPTDINVHGGVGYVDLTGIGSNYPNYGTLTQSLTTVSGQTYNVSLWSTIFGGGGVNVLANGGSVGLSGGYGTYGGPGGTSWGQLTGSFKATGASTLFSIQGFSIGGPFYVIGVDDVSVTGGGVPEPATWALMLLGFGGLGAALRARRKTVAGTV